MIVVLLTMAALLVWVPGPNLTTARGAHGLAALGGKLYAVGGESAGLGSLSSVEAYDPQQNRWDAAAPLSGTRVNHVMAAI